MQVRTTVVRARPLDACARGWHARTGAGRSPGMTASGPHVGHALDEGLARFRDVRRRLEQAVLPLATSLDGRRFVFQASLHGLELRLGGYVMVEAGDMRR